MFTQDCPRDFKDCKVLDNVCADEVFKSSGKPVSFICCGSSDPKTRALKRDRFRLCFKTQGSDSITDNDEYDILDMISVLTRGMSIQRRRDESAKDKKRRKHPANRRSFYG